nr:retrovirus-related Pol polyprotein from transposon TNT 1-94 [Tanacetum cinerariifolium]
MVLLLLNKEAKEGTAIVYVILEITYLCFHGFIDKDLINLVIPDVRRDHLGKFDEKADDGFFLRNSPFTKSFRVFSIRRKEIEETYHVTFSEDDEEINQTSIEGDEIKFNENRSFPDDEFLVLRSKIPQSLGKDD